METIKDLKLLETLLPFAVIIFIIGIGVIFLNLHFQRNLSLQKLRQDELKMEHQVVLLKSNIQAQEEERRRIAQDLHDELGAVLSIMRMHLVLLEQQANENTLAGLLQTRKLGETALASVRSISHRLIPPQLESFGLIQTLEAVADQVNSAGKVTILLTTIDFIELPWEVSLGMYRIIMELINNTIRHSGADRIDLEIYLREGTIMCEYHDNGCGIDEAQLVTGLGLKNIEGRVSSLNGYFKIKNGPEAGCYALIKIPIVYEN